MSIGNDLPITHPDQDVYGFDPFAKAISRSISDLSDPYGTVIAIDGEWGSGKSSAINLVRHHLNSLVAKKELEIAVYSPWLFHSEVALMQEFIATLSDSFQNVGDKTLSDQFLQFGKRLAPLKAVLDGVDLGTFGNAIKKLAFWSSREKGVSQIRKEIEKKLASQNKRILVVVDDLDRLSPDEVVLVLKLIKAAGRLPNVIYLLAFDRTVVQEAVAKTFSAGGDRYLEKICQAVFPIPEAERSDVNNALLHVVAEVCGEPEEDRITDFMNLFYEAVAHLLTSPRDVLRFKSQLSVTWPGVAGDVDIGDFVALEAIRLADPLFYSAIRRNRSFLCCSGRRLNDNQEVLARNADQQLLSGIEEDQKDKARKILQRLFPQLQAIWGNTIFSDSVSNKQNRRVCHDDHFNSYFRYQISDATLPISELEGLVARIEDKEHVQSVLLNALQQPNRSGGTKASVWLQKLNVYVSQLSDEQTDHLLSALFEIADKLDVEADKGKGFLSISDNKLRLHWLLRSSILERWPLEERSMRLLRLAERASLGWLVHIAMSAHRDHHPREGKDPEPDENCLLTKTSSEELIGTALSRIRAAVEDNSLSPASRIFLDVVFRWRDFSPDGASEVQAWTSSHLADDEWLMQFSDALRSESWSHGMGGLGDLVARRNERVIDSGLNDIIDVDAFRSRLEGISGDSGSQYQEASANFLSIWEQSNRDGVAPPNTAME